VIAAIGETPVVAVPDTGTAIRLWKNSLLDRMDAITAA
jgi:hypothetical protein